MSRIVHCSDLHYGKGFQPLQAERLAGQIRSLDPDAVVVSGDLTMRARAGQFLQARALLEQIKVPRLIVPGNHDVPLYNLPLRLMDPFRNYRRYANDLSTNPIVLDHAGILGLNTVNPWRHQKGRVVPEDLTRASDWLSSLPPDSWRILVVHQHFSDLEGNERPGAMHNAHGILDAFSRGGAHMVLCGHTHFCHIGSTAETFPTISRPMVVINAGTATSCRARSADCGPKVNTFNVLEFEADSFKVHSYGWNCDSNDFAVMHTRQFDRTFFGEHVKAAS